MCVGAAGRHRQDQKRRQRRDSGSFDLENSAAIAQLAEHPTVEISGSNQMGPGRILGGRIALDGLIDIVVMLAVWWVFRSSGFPP